MKNFDPDGVTGSLALLGQAPSAEGRAASRAPLPGKEACGCPARAAVHVRRWKSAREGMGFLGLDNEAVQRPQEGDSAPA